MAAQKIVKAIPVNVGTEEAPVSAFLPEDGREIHEPIIMVPDSDGIRWFWDGDPTPIPPPIVEVTDGPEPLPLLPPADA